MTLPASVSSQLIWLNDRLVRARRAAVSIFDHGFLYGDGIYETVHAYGGRIFHWPTHFKRLQQSARLIGLRLPWSSRKLERAVSRVLSANRKPNGSVRITVTRGPGSLGLNPALCSKPTLVMQLHPDRDLSPHWKRGVTIGIPQVRRNPREALDPQIKATSSLNTVLAKMEAERMGVFEAVLLNSAGFLTEGTTCNIFWARKGVLYTPALSNGLLAGVTRGAVLRLARRKKWPVREGNYRLPDVRRADECFLSSTTLEIMPVVAWRSFDARRMRRIGTGQPGPLTRQLQGLFRSLVERETKLL